MSTKELKIIFKDVRELIKNEKYHEAVKKCEDILHEEPNSYMGELLMGAAYQTINKQEAAKHLRRAMELSNGAPTVALQGLANCAPAEDLPKILNQLIDLVPEKHLDYYEKLYNISSNSKVFMECFKVFQQKLQQCSENDLNKRMLLLKYVGRVSLRNDMSADLLDQATYKLVLENILSDPSLDVYLIAFKRYLKLLFKMNDMAKCLENACKMVELFPNDIYAYEWICKIYCEKYQDKQNLCLSALPKSPDEYATKLLELNSDSHLALTVKAIILYKVQHFVNARELLYQAVKEQPDYAPTVQLLAQCEMHLEAYALAAPLWQKLGAEFDLQYAVSLSYVYDDQKLNEALLILQQQEASIETIQAIARCFFALNKVDEIKNLKLDNISKAEYLMSPAEGIAFLNSNTTDLEHFPSLLLLGKLYYRLKNYMLALNHILKATRLQPYSSQCFFYLGKVYFAVNDIVRSRKCFEKCLSLNPSNGKAVEYLSGIYQQLNEEDLNEALLTNTAKSLKCMEQTKHLHYRLGLHYLHVKNWDEAIQSFRTAIKQDVSCMIYWESLGDAYAERGSYNSAVRVFQKILEMQPNNLYARLQVALVNTTIRMYGEAIEDFAVILKDNPDYLPALKGAAEAHMGLANNMKTEKRYGRTKQHLQLAVDMLQRCFLQGDNLKMVWLWRLTANAFMLTAQLPESLANLDVDGKLAGRDNHELVFLTRKDILKLAVRFYTCALKIKQNTYLWYELALCCYYMADYVSEEADVHLDMAIKACQMAISEQPDKWQNWNLLGVIQMHPAIDNLAIAQHCFIQTLQLERKSYIAWTNLGVLYLKLQEIKLANQAFQRAQQSSPIYANAWIGQALIAEAISEEEEALDLFRHCQQFEFHTESALGYAHWVCSILSDEQKCQLKHYKHAINSMHADVVALDAISWYTMIEEQETTSAAYSFQGFLSERQKLYRSASKTYALAAEKANTSTERNLMYTNLGYVYLKLNEAEEAVNAFNKVSQASFHSIIGLALSYFKGGQCQEAYSVYNSVVKSMAGVDDNKTTRILVAMASMVYAFQGEADTKTILYQCILLKDFPIQALYSACALGILHQDEQLTETILTELKKHEDCLDHVVHIAYLTAQYYLKKKLPRKAFTYLMTRVHIYPQCAALRKVLANFLLNNYHQKGKQYHLVTSRIALSAISLVRSSKTNKNDCIEDAETLLIASRALLPMHGDNARKLLQRAVHLNPQNVNAWNLLLQVH